MSEDQLPPIPSHWTWAPLGEIAEVQLGKMLSNKAFGPGLIQLPYLRNQNVRWGTIDYSDVKLMGFKPGELERYGLKAGDLLVCEGGEPGRCAIYTRGAGDFMYQKALHRIRPLQDVIQTKYLQYCLWNYVENGQVLPRLSETTIRHLPLEKLVGLPIPVAPRAEQTAIVQEIEKQFTRLDAASTTLQRAQASLKSYRASLLKAAFEGRLVPTEAELARAEGREHETAHSLLNRRQEGSEKAGPKGLRALPSGWAWAYLHELGAVTGGVTKHHQRENLPSQLPYLRVANVYANELRLENMQIIGVTPGELERCLLRKHDLLIVEGNGSEDQIGRAAIWNGEIEPCVHQNHIIKVRPRLEKLSQFMLAWLLSPEGRQHIRRVASSTSGLHTLSISKIETLPVPVPPLVEQGRIIAQLESILSRIENTNAIVTANLVRSESLRKTILHQAFSGKLALQDPADEPASALLERIRKERAQQSGTKSRRSRPPKAAPPAPQESRPSGAVESVVGPGPGAHAPGFSLSPLRGSEAARVMVEEVVVEGPEFAGLSRSEQIDAVWEALFGLGALEKVEAVRIAAEALRARGVARFQRLRRGGHLSESIRKAIEAGVREGAFDRPARGQVRAVLRNPRDYAPETWQRCLLGVLDHQALDQDEALRGAAEWARENLGLEFARLREDGVILGGLREALNGALRAGIIRKTRSGYIQRVERS